MALIEVKITAETPQQFGQIIAALAAVQQVAGLGVTGPDVPSATAASAPVPEAADAQPDEKPKRKRRTKAEIAAEIEANKAAVKEPAEPEQPTEPDTPTRQDVDMAMRALLAVGGTSGDKMIEILVSLGAVNDAGNAKISALDEAKYAEAIEMANTAAAEAVAAAANAESVLG